MPTQTSFTKHHLVHHDAYALLPEILAKGLQPCVVCKEMDTWGSTPSDVTSTLSRRYGQHRRIQRACLHKSRCPVDLRGGASPSTIISAAYAIELLTIVSDSCHGSFTFQGQAGRNQPVSCRSCKRTESTWLGWYAQEPICLYDMRLRLPRVYDVSASGLRTEP